MIVGFADKAWEDYQYWILNDKKILKRNPFDSDGLG